VLLSGIKTLRPGTPGEGVIVWTLLGQGDKYLSPKIITTLYFIAALLLFNQGGFEEVFKFTNYGLET
jgi:hypothetical protein